MNKCLIFKVVTCVAMKDYINPLLQLIIILKEIVLLLFDLSPEIITESKKYDLCTPLSDDFAIEFRGIDNRNIAQGIKHIRKGE